MDPSRHRVFLTSCLARLALVLLLALHGSAIGLGAATFKTSSLKVSPETLVLRGAETGHGLLVTAISREGTQADVTAQARFSSSDPRVVTVTTNGVCHTRGDGAARVWKLSECNCFERSPLWISRAELDREAKPG